MVQVLGADSISVAAVSYTHLDVYKRQGQGSTHSVDEWIQRRWATAGNSFLHRNPRGLGNKQSLCHQLRRLDHEGFREKQLNPQKQRGLRLLAWHSPSVCPWAGHLRPWANARALTGGPASASVPQPAGAPDQDAATEFPTPARERQVQRPYRPSPA